MTRVAVDGKWRHFTPEALPLNFTTKRNVPIDIDLSSILVQGAKSQLTNEPDQNIIQALGQQRGWNVEFIIVNQPKEGRVVKASDGRGLRYLPPHDYAGQDCFNYATIVNGQKSKVTRCDITVETYFGLSILPLRITDTQSFRYQANIHIPTELGSPSEWTVVHRWYHQQPKRYFNAQRGRFEVGILIDEWHSTTVGPLGQILSSGAGTPKFDYVWPDSNLQGFVAGTDTPYVPQDGPFPLSLRTEFNKNPNIVDGFWDGTWGEQHVLEADIITERGADWWSKGSYSTVSS